MKIAVALLIAVVGMFAQAPVSRPAFESFEVATVKPTPPEWGRGRYVRMQSAHQLVAKNYELRVLIAFAFSLSPQAISGGPAWIDSDHYDVLAETPGDVRPTLEEQLKMLRQLLVDRFKLTFHREPKEFSIYALTVAKNGLKMKESTVDPNATPEGPLPLVFVLSPESVRLPGRYATVAELAAVMQRSALDRPVLDRTGLTGRYDFDLEFTPDETQFGGAGLKGTPESTKPDLFAALQQQLGLRLEATRGPIDTLVIDRIERPSEN
jgi:uncharacterized protein (TIGR03435 family)